MRAFDGIDRKPGRCGHVCGPGLCHDGCSPSSTASSSSSSITATAAAAIFAASTSSAGSMSYYHVDAAPLGRDRSIIGSVANEVFHGIHGFDRRNVSDSPWRHSAQVWSLAVPSQGFGIRAFPVTPLHFVLQKLVALRICLVLLRSWQARKKTANVAALTALTAVHVRSRRRPKLKRLRA